MKNIELKGRRRKNEWTAAAAVACVLFGIIIFNYPLFAVIASMSNAAEAAQEV